MTGAPASNLPQRITITFIARIATSWSPCPALSGAMFFPISRRRPAPSSAASSAKAQPLIGDVPANLDHDPGNNRPRNLSGFCQRCHPIRNRSHHLARRITYPLRRALGDLFLGPYSA
ncbi:MAG TPA: hypothetical protein VET89_01980 [Stellaceae bacterium]|nr:hypothetical protein [Stellaceae bacterium]